MYGCAVSVSVELHAIFMCFCAHVVQKLHCDHPVRPHVFSSPSRVISTLSFPFLLFHYYVPPAAPEALIREKPTAEALDEVEEMILEAEDVTGM